MSNCKLLCRQIAPEHQESPMIRDILFGDADFEYSIAGNREYKGYQNPEYKAAEEALRLLSEYLEDEDESVANLVTEACAGFDIKPAKTDDTPWREALKTWSTPRRQEDGIAKAISLIAGREYCCRTIHGSTQGEWQYLYCPTDYDRETIDAIGTEYWNMGSEWIVSDEMIPAEGFNEKLVDPRDITGYNHYSTCWRTEDIRREIADAFGADPGDVVLYEFAGYISIQTYKGSDRKERAMSREDAFVRNPEGIQTDLHPEFRGQLVDVVEDFLESKGIDIPNPEKSESEDPAIIYGSDYDALANGLAGVVIAWLNEKTPDPNG